MKNLPKGEIDKFLSKFVDFTGAGGGTRTRTPSLAMDFESTSSADSNTPAKKIY